MGDYAPVTLHDRTTPTPPQACIPGAVLAFEGDGGTLVALIGEHDLATLPAIEGAMSDATAAGGLIVVDLSGCAFIDCGALGCILRAMDEAQVEVVAPHSTALAVRRVLDITGVRTTSASPLTVL